MSKKKIEDVCVSMDDLHEIWSVPLCIIRWLSVQYNNKKRHLGFYSNNKVGTLWSVLYFYCNWQLSAKKKKNSTGVGGNGSHSSGSGTGFSSSFSWDWDGKRLKFVMHFGNRRWAPGLMRHLAWETRSQRLTFSHYLGSTHILNAFGRIQMSHFNLD